MVNLKKFESWPDRGTKAEDRPQPQFWGVGEDVKILCLCLIAYLLGMGMLGTIRSVDRSPIDA